MSKISPAEMLARVQAIWPEVHTLKRHSSGFVQAIDLNGDRINITSESSVKVEWPKGVTQWPVPGKWRDATLDDVNKGLQARFKDDNDMNWCDTANTDELTEVRIRWVDQEKVGWQQCQVWDPSL